MILIIKQTIQEIIDNVQVLSQYRSNSLLQKGNDIPLDDTPLSNDDTALLKKYLKSGCREIIKVLSGYQSSIFDEEGNALLPFEFGVMDPPEPQEGETQKEIIIIRMAMPETFNTAVLSSLDDAVRDALENYLLHKTSKQKANENQSYLQDFEDAKGQIRTFINMRTAPTRRNYNILE